MIERPTVVIRIEADGTHRYHVAGAARVIVVDERPARDLVFELGASAQVSGEYIAAVIGDAPVLTLEDMLAGAPRPGPNLRVVK